MSHIIKLKEFDPKSSEVREYPAEHFGDAVVCCGHVALREENRITVNDAPGQCWGEYIDAPTGSYDCIGACTLDRDMRFCIDDAGAMVELVSISSNQPPRLDYCRHVGVPPLRRGERQARRTYRYIANFRTLPIKGEDGKIEIYCVEDDREIILIPGYYNGHKVKRADLTGCKMGNCHTLIVDSAVEELIVDFYNAYRLERIEIADSTNIIGGPGFVSRTPWFAAQPKGQVYLSNWYCGSRGDIDMGRSRLELRSGCVGVAPGADRESYWKAVCIPPTVLSIGSFAFSSMPCLKEIEFSEGLKTIGDTVFWSCPRLEHLVLPDSLEKPGDYSFDLLPCLKSALMSRRSYHDGEYFLSNCGELSIRGGSAKTKTRRPPRPINGEITAYARGRRLYVSGRVYRSPAQLTAEKICTNADGSSDWLDVYGNRVRFLDFYDTGLIDSRGKYYREKRWYVQHGRGITEISRRRNDTVFLVHENLALEDVHPNYREYVSDLFAREN